MESNNQPGPGNDPLQFDRVEPLATGSASASCASCNRDIAGSYFEVAGKIFCEECKNAVLAAFQGGSKFVRFTKALLAGLSAAIVCAAGWLVIVKLTGYVIGLIAIVVGVVIGIAVRKGASGRGGWVYQGMAIVLTYLAIASSYVPDVIQMMLNGDTEQASALVKSDKERSRVTIHRNGSVTLNDHASSPEETAKEMERLKSVGGFAMYYREGRGDVDAPPSADIIANKWAELRLPVVYYSDPQFKTIDNAARTFGNAPIPGKLFLVGVALFFSIQIPFFELQSHPISLLITGFALWEAWKINKRPRINITGPHVLNPQKATATVANDQFPPNHGDPGGGPSFESTPQ